MLVKVSFLHEGVLSATSAFKESEALHDLQDLRYGPDSARINLEATNVKATTPTTASTSFTAFFLRRLFRECLHETTNRTTHPYLSARQELRDPSELHVETDCE